MDVKKKKKKKTDDTYTEEAYDRAVKLLFTGADTTLGNSKKILLRLLCDHFVGEPMDGTEDMTNPELSNILCKWVSEHWWYFVRWLIHSAPAKPDPRGSDEIQRFVAALDTKISPEQVRPIN